MITKSRAPIVAAAPILALAGLAAIFLSACAGGLQPTPVTATVAAETQIQTPEVTPSPERPSSQEGSPSEVVVYASDLPESALYEFDFWDDPASPMGKMVGTPNEGGELDPPPENDPNVTFTVPVQSGVPYRCWIHMKVGPPKGWSQANMLWVQFTDAVDKANQEVFKPDTASYLTAQGPEEQGWTWVGCDLADAETPEAQIYFRVSGEVTVRLQAGMEGVGFDQFVLSPAQFLEQPPSGAVVEKIAEGD